MVVCVCLGFFGLVFSGFLFPFFSLGGRVNVK